MGMYICDGCEKHKDSRNDGFHVIKDSLELCDICLDDTPEPHKGRRDTIKWLQRALLNRSIL